MEIRILWRGKEKTRTWVAIRDATAEELSTGVVKSNAAPKVCALSLAFDLLMIVVLSTSRNTC